MLEVHTAGSWLVLGRFLARSGQNLGKSWQDLANISDEKLRKAKTSPREPKGGQRMTKNAKKKAQREPKGAKRKAKGSQNEPKWRPKAAQGEGKQIQKR